MELHSFGHERAKAVCAALFAVVKQGGRTNVGLVAGRARLAMQDVGIPRFELVFAHMATKPDG